MTRIFAGDLIDLLEYADGAKGDVLQIADWGTNKIKAAAGRCIRGLYRLGGRNPGFHADESSTRSGSPFALAARSERAKKTRKEAGRDAGATAEKSKARV